MADDDSSHASGSEGTPTTASPPPNTDELHAQAVRFLTSVKLQGHASEEEQRAFLRSKGLDDAAIERAYKDATRPQEGASTSDSGSALSTRTKQLTSLPPEEAFDAAAKAFDDPIHAELPEKTYPKSPLALYYDEAQSGTQANPAGSAAAPESPLTRYQVLLNFFRSLSFMMMLGGGCTAVLVGLYRIYIMPRLVASQDARSILLKHHNDLYEQLTLKVKSLRRASLAQAPSLVAAGVGGESGRQLKSALKKQVSFSKDTKPAPPDEDESSALLRHSQKEGEKEKIVVPGSDVVVEALTAGSEEKAEEGHEDDQVGEGEGEREKGETKKIVQPIDVSVPLRTSLQRLATALKADTSAAARGTPIVADSSASGSTSSSASNGPHRPTVQDAADEAFPSESESEDEGGDDDDELEFDPFGSFTNKKEKKGSKKHGQRTSIASADPNASIGNAGTALRASLSSLSAAVSTQTFMASSVAFNNNFRYSGLGNDLTSSVSSNDNANGKEGEETENKQKAGDVSVVKAEIRGLKGLLLSRRNFPSYMRQNLVPASTVSQG